MLDLNPNETHHTYFNWNVQKWGKAPWATIGWFSEYIFKGKIHKKFYVIFCIKVRIHAFIFVKLNRKDKWETKSVAYRGGGGWYPWSGRDREGNETSKYTLLYSFDFSTMLMFYACKK